jgi:hypothetical protein
MDKIKKKRILQDCNNTNFTIDKLNQFVAQGDITIEEFRNNGLDPTKLKELERRENERKGIFVIPEPPKEEPIVTPGNKGYDPFANNNIIFENQKKNVDPFSEQTTQISTPKVTITPHRQNATTNQKLELIDKVLREEVGVEQIRTDISNGLYTYNDLEAAGLPKHILNAMQYYPHQPLVKHLSIGDLPPMDKGRTDLFFIGIAGSGKSVMLGGLLQYANKKGMIIPDTYNQEGHKYSAQLTSDLERGVLPKATNTGSYNYIAASLKDSNKVAHPLNIVEVPGENYTKIFENGIQTEEVKGFVSYIKNDNRKIFIFVLDALEHQTRLDRIDSGLYKQGDIYVSILNMLKDNKILERTEAIYIVVNKFDVIKKEKDPANQIQDITLADEFVHEEFMNLLNNCIDAKERTRNKLTIKVFPFSIGEVCYDNILKSYNTEYSKLIIDQILEDSFIVKGGLKGFMTGLFKK